VSVLLSGNALAVHDIEVALSGTSLGIDLNTGHPVEHGHRNHMRAINAVRRAGGIGRAVEAGVLRSGIMHACHTHGVRYILAGSIRDDGPLPETMMDLVQAQEAYAAALADVEIVVMLSSMLHSIGVGNMLPSWVKVICVDINPAVVTKLADRGSTQTVGIVTDVGLFLHQLAEQLQ
jgi:lysine-ketoglutarate reductase/saccharopine dehydrogenase-like protein (TIGR00300 family)